jgi:glycosyltransferase involved in cell wall biosynthesis
VRPRTPRVSILLPFYNAAQTVAEALGSLRAQTFTDWDCIAWDDGSTDDSVAVVQAIAARDPRIRLQGGGHTGIVNALQAARGRVDGSLLARMDADDIARPERLARQVALFDRDPQIALCGTRVAMLGHIGSGRARYAEWLDDLCSPQEIVRELFVECPLPHPTFMMRADAFDAAGGYRDCTWPEEYDLVMRLWQRGERMAKVPEVLLYWREHPARLSMRDPRYAPAAFRALKRHYLMATYLRGRAQFHQWGAGEVGKPWLREWDTARPAAVIDIRPGKVGQRIHGYAVLPPEALPPPGGTFVVIAVGTPGAREIIRDWLIERGYAECDDFIFVA